MSMLQLFLHHLFNRYGATNLQFGIYYDKVFKKEYLPSRIRYSQFFFYSAALYFFYTLHTRVRKIFHGLILLLELDVH